MTEQPATAPAPTGGKSARWLFAVFGVELIVIAAYAISLSRTPDGKYNSDGRYTAALLAISVVIELLAAFLDHELRSAKRVLWGLVAAEAVKIVMLIVFSAIGGQITTDFWSWVSFSAGFGVIWFAAWATVFAWPAAVAASKESAISPHTLPFVLFCTFAAFLHVCIFFALSIGFHDRAVRNRSNDQKRGALYATTPADAVPKPPEAVAATAPDLDPNHVWKFFFRESDAELRCTQFLLQAVDDRNRMNAILEAEQTERLAILNSILKTMPQPSVCSEPGDVDRAAWNLHEIYEIKQKLQALRQTDNVFECNINGFAHANSKAVGSDNWNTNQALSASRADAVQLLLNNLRRQVRPEVESSKHEGFTDRKPIEDAQFAFKDIHISPKGSQNVFLEMDPIKWAIPEGLSKELSVEIQMLPVKNPPGQLQHERDKRKPLALLDYVYFVIYTLTTTGYGDLVPTDAMTKFITSIANLAEFFFIVIVINSLVVSRSKQS
jgi:hypothetical protein